MLSNTVKFRSPLPSICLSVSLLTVPLLLLIRRYRGRFYDYVIFKMTSVWYSSVVLSLPANSRVLDIGMGTATSLLWNLPTIRKKGLRFSGVDFTQEYVTAAKVNIEANNAVDFVECIYGSVYDTALLKTLASTSLFDAVYFSGSISLMPDPAGALLAVSQVLKPGGSVFVTQTFQTHALPGMRLMKPLVKYATTIDFGELVMQKEILLVYATVNSTLELVKHEKIAGSVDNIFQAAYLSELRLKR